MRRYVWPAAIALAFLIGCGSAPSVAAPAPQPTLAPTVISLDQIDLEPLLIQSGDLPEGLVGNSMPATPHKMFNLPGLFADITPAQRMAYQAINRGSMMTGGVATFLYAATKDRDRAYSFMADGMSKVKPLGNIGDRAQITVVEGALTATEQQSKKRYALVDILFQRCAAVAYIRIRTDGDVEALTKAYAQRLDKRLSAAVC